MFVCPFILCFFFHGCFLWLLYVPNSFCAIDAIEHWHDCEPIVSDAFLLRLAVRRMSYPANSPTAAAVVVQQFGGLCSPTQRESVEPPVAWEAVSVAGACWSTD